jgi:hypothetical protein
MVCAAAWGVAGCATAGGGDASAVMRTPETRAATAYAFAAADETLLDEIEHTCFLYFWEAVGQPACLARDRLKAPCSSVAAVGFQLSSLPIGVERGWITRAQGATRARTVLKALIEREDNKKFGVYLHYPDMNTGGMSHVGFEVLASTVDHALLLAGALTAAEYFGGEVDALVGRMVADTNYRAFAVGKGGLLSMGWTPKDPENMAGPGTFHGAVWKDSADEERLIHFLAVGLPNPAHRLEPRDYYRLHRPIERHKDMPPYVVTYPGALFTYIFSHCWIDYRGFEADDPRAFGVDAPRVDWFENSRRAALTHRQRCIEQMGRFKTFAPDRWGLSACAARDGYLVPRVQPNLADSDEWGAGTVAPYAAGGAIMFTPAESLAALRAFRTLKRPDGTPAVWWDRSEGGYGLVDCFNLDQDFKSDDYVGIDHGPMLLAIENARTGLIWKLFMRHEVARRAVERLKLKPLEGR